MTNESNGRPVLLGDLVTALHRQGFNALLLLLALPFMTPIPLPGVSTPFGVVIALLGLQMALARRLWVPEGMRRRELPSRFLPRFLNSASRACARLERVLKPRWLYPEFPAVFRRISGILILISGLLLLIPLPVPFSNAFPALVVLLLAAAGLEEDGMVFLAGCVHFLLCLSYFSLLAIGGDEVWHQFVR